MPALAGGSLPVLGSGKIEQLKLKISNVKLCNPVFSPFIFYSKKNSNIKPWIWHQLLFLADMKH